MIPGNGGMRAMELRGALVQRQPECRQRGPGQIGACVADAADAEALGDLDEQGPVLDVQDAIARHLGHVQDDAEDLGVGLTVADEARGDKGDNCRLRRRDRGAGECRWPDRGIPDARYEGGRESLITGGAAGDRI